jgi:hypothetical protein
MNRRLFITYIVATAGLLACNQEPVSPTRNLSTTTVRSNLLGVLGEATMSVVNRTTPLPSEVSVTKVISESGGTIEIPAAGVSVNFPSGALKQATSITVTAYAGSNVAYGFAPHGITFARPVKITQNLKGTTAGGLSLNVLLNLNGAYLPDGENSISSDGTATVTELLPISISLDGILSTLNAKASFSITHFSGYMLSWGRSTQ